MWCAQWWLGAVWGSACEDCYLGEVSAVGSGAILDAVYGMPLWDAVWSAGWGGCSGWPSASVSLLTLSAVWSATEISDTCL